MKIGILGGSFDPPHFGHLSLSQQLLKANIVDEVWLSPCFSHAFDKKMSWVENRVAMAKLLTNNKIKMSEIEAKRERTSYTIETLEALSQLHPQHVFFWIMGSDQVPLFTKYKNWQKILGKYNLIVFPRENMINTEIKNIKNHIIFLDPKEFKIINASSTEIREKVKMGKSISGLVPQSIAQYISEQRLYL
jgi:nicotinate-nucleotide adenylyltransferase